jgi:hypothetical protein
MLAHLIGHPFAKTKKKEEDMKKLWYISIILVPFVVFALFTGCPSGGVVY